MSDPLVAREQGPENAWTTMRALLIIAAILVLGLLGALWLTRREGTHALAPAVCSASTSGDDHASSRAVSTNMAATDNDGGRVRGSPSNATSDVTMTVPGCRVYGRLVDQVGIPIEHAQVTLVPWGGPWSEDPASSKTDAGGAESIQFAVRSARDGRFDLEVPLPTCDCIHLDIEPDLYHARFTCNFGPAGDRNRPRLVKGDNDLGDIKLVVCGSASGRLMSADGSPVVGAGVRMHAPDGVECTSSADVGDDGHFLIGHLPPGKGKLELEARGWLTRDGIQVDVRPRAMTILPDLVLARAFSISGVVVDSNGAPVPHVSVWCHESDGKGSAAHTGEDGSFTAFMNSRFPGVLEIEAGKGFDHWGGGPEARYEAGSTDVRIVLHRSPSMTFRVIDAHTQVPIESFGIRLDDPPKYGGYDSAVEQELRQENHPRGEVSVPLSKSQVVVYALGHAPLETPVVADAGSKDVQTLALRSSSTITGQLDLAGTAPLQAAITLQREGIDKEHTYSSDPGAWSNALTHDVGGYSGRRREFHADENGRFHLGDLVAGTYVVQIDAVGAARKRLRGVLVPDESTLDLGDIVLDRGTMVRGVLFAGIDQSPEGFKVRLDHDFEHESFIDNVDGRFEFTGLDPGSHTISWSRPTQSFWGDDDPHRQALNLTAGEVRDIILDASGSTPCTVLVHVQRRNSSQAGVRVAARIRSTMKPEGVLWSMLGTSDQNGLVKGEVDGDVMFELVAVTDKWAALSGDSDSVQAIPGGRIEQTLTLSIGSLVVELPEGFAIPEDGCVSVQLERPGQTRRDFSACTRPTRDASPDLWTSNRIRFAEIEAGAYEATVWVQRLSSSAQAQGIDLRQPYKTHLVIEPDHEAQIVVP